MVARKTIEPATPKKPAFQTSPIWDSMEKPNAVKAMASQKTPPRRAKK